MSASQSDKGTTERIFVKAISILLVCLEELFEDKKQLDAAVQRRRAAVPSVATGR
jgi:hypothetical protein